MGSDSNGSGVVALLEIARLFSSLYSSPKTRGKYNLLFALTSGGPYNYNGTHKVLIPTGYIPFFLYTWTMGIGSCFDVLPPCCSGFVVWTNDCVRLLIILFA